MRMRIISLAITLAAVAACANAPLRSSGALSDCRDCPAMVAVPAGTFVMGAPDDEVGRFPEEGPTHEVRVAEFAASRTPITRREYAAFVRATGRADPGDCASMNDAGEWRATPGLSWRAPGFDQGEDHPVVCVSWDDAQAYVAWLSGRTGRSYSLLSEAEFEYAARAGANTSFPWGDAAGEACAYANGFDLTAKRAHPDWGSLDCDDGFAFTAPV